MRTSLCMKKVGLVYLPVYNDSTGIIAKYHRMGVDPSPSLLQHVKKISGTSGNYFFEMKGDVGMA